ncbi:MAG: anhydro-N-acetylmuramic acid kinase, partial [Pseudomonadota bacterium]
MGEAEAVWALGCMSGTSLDGIDAAFLRTDGRAIFEFGPTRYRPYRNEVRGVLRAALGNWEAPDAARAVTEAHIEVLRGFGAPELIG